MNCLNEHGAMKKVSRVEETTFRGLALRYGVELWTCPGCGIEVEDLSLSADNQRALSEAYRKAAGLLTGDEIAEGQKRLAGARRSLLGPST